MDISASYIVNDKLSAELSQTNIVKTDAITDFKNKITGSTVSNPSVARFSAVLGGTTLNPIYGTEYNQSYYNVLAAKDGSSIAATTSATGAYLIQNFIIDILSARKIAENNPNLAVADLRTATPELVVAWSGFGYGDSGGVQTFGVQLLIYNRVTAVWDVIGSHNNAVSTEIAATYTTNLANYIDDLGHVVLSAHPIYAASSTVINSLSSDYVMANAKYNKPVREPVGTQNNSLKVIDLAVIDNLTTLVGKVTDVVTGKSNVKTREVEDYSYNIKHLEGFKTTIKTLSTQAIVPIGVAGDSISEGTGSTNYLVNAYPSIIRDVLQSKYGIVGSGFLSSWRRASSTTNVWTKTGTWNSNNWSSMLPQAATGAVTITGTGFRLLYGAATDGGLFDVSVDGAAAVSVNASGTVTAIKEYVIGGLAFGSHTITVTAQEVGKTLYLVGIIPTNQLAGIRLDNFSWFGKTTGMVADTLYQNVATRDNPLLMIIALTANDYQGQSSLKGYKSNLQSFITACKTHGTYILLLANGIRSEPGQVEQIWYTSMLYELADENDIALIDVNQKWVSFENANTLGYMADTVHLTDKGNLQLSREVLKYILR